MQGPVAKALRLFCDYVVGGLLLISTPYPTGVEYDCAFLAAFVQKKLRKRLHTFFFNRTPNRSRWELMA